MRSAGRLCARRNVRWASARRPPHCPSSPTPAHRPPSSPPLSVPRARLEVRVVHVLEDQGGRLGLGVAHHVQQPDDVGPAWQRAGGEREREEERGRVLRAWGGSPRQAQLLRPRPSPLSAPLPPLPRGCHCTAAAAPPRADAPARFCRIRISRLIFFFFTGFRILMTHFWLVAVLTPSKTSEYLPAAAAAARRAAAAATAACSGV